MRRKMMYMCIFNIIIIVAFFLPLLTSCEQISNINVDVGEGYIVYNNVKYFQPNGEEYRNVRLYTFDEKELIGYDWIGQCYYKCESDKECNVIFCAGFGEVIYVSEEFHLPAPEECRIEKITLYDLNEIDRIYIDYNFSGNKTIYDIGSRLDLDTKELEYTHYDINIYFSNYSYFYMRGMTIFKSDDGKIYLRFPNCLDTFLEVNEEYKYMFNDLML